MNSSKEQIDKLIEEFDPNKVPANLALAELHQKARKVGRPLNLKTQGLQQKLCPCCGCQVEKYDVSFFEDNIHLGFLGSGIPLYYQFVKFGIVLLAIIVVVSGIRGLLHNKKGDGCYIQTFGSTLVNDPQSSCRYIYQNIYSTSNSVTLEKNTPDPTYGGLNLLTTIALMIACLCFRRSQNLVVTKIDQNNVTATDFTIMFEQLPVGVTKQQIEQYIERQMGPYIKNNVRKIVLAYDIDAFVRLQRDLAAQAHIKASLELQKTQGQSIDETALQETIQKIKTIEENIAKFQKQAQGQESTFQSCGVAFVTFEKDENVEYVEASLKMNFLERFAYENFCESKKKFGNKIPIAVRAPEPSDIYWENLSIPLEEKIRKRILTNFASAICIAVCFGILYGMSSIQESIRKGQDSGNIGIQLISLLMGFLIAFINNVLAVIIRYFAVMEKHITYTNYLSSVSTKLGIAQFLNTAIIQLIVFRIQSDDEFMIQGGLNEDMIWISITNAGIPILFGILNPWYLQRLYKRDQIRKGNYKKMSQIEANKIFEGPPFDLAQSYAQTIKTLLLCSFYAYQLPLMPAIGAIGLILYYNLSKYLLLSRNHVPYSIGSQISEDMTDFFLELIILIHAVGCLVFERYIFKEITGYSIAQIVLGGLYYLLPIEKFCECCVKIQRQITQESYSQVSLILTSDYDRANPVTQESAIEQWMLEISKMAGASEEQLKRIQQQRQQQAGQYVGNGLGGLMNYAQTRQTMSQINQQVSFGFGNRVFARNNIPAPVFQPVINQNPLVGQQNGQMRVMMNNPLQNNFYNHQIQQGLQMLQTNPAVMQMFQQRQQAPNQQQQLVQQQQLINQNMVKAPVLQNPLGMNSPGLQVNRVVPQQDQSMTQTSQTQNLLENSMQVNRNQNVVNPQQQPQQNIQFRPQQPSYPNQIPQYGIQQPQQYVGMQPQQPYQQQPFQQQSQFGVQPQFGMQPQQFVPQQQIQGQPYFQQQQQFQNVPAYQNFQNSQRQ